MSPGDPRRNQLDGASRDDILTGTSELVSEVMNRNGLTTDAVISVLVSRPGDLTASSALAARKLGFQDVRCVRGGDQRAGSIARRPADDARRTPAARRTLQHVLLRGASVLRLASASDRPVAPARRFRHPGRARRLVIIGTG